MRGRMNAGVGTTSSRPSGTGASPRCSTNVRARSISPAYAPTSAPVQMVGAQPLHHVAPVLPVPQPRRALRQVRLHLLAQMQAVAPQLRRRVAQCVLVVQPEVERVLAQREPVRGRLEPALEIVLEVP